jgi:hypothetical protein
VWLKERLPSVEDSNFDIVRYKVFVEKEDPLPRALSFASSLWMNERVIEQKDLSPLLDNIVELSKVLISERDRLNDTDATPYLILLSEILFHLRHDFFDCVLYFAKRTHF